ncbi:MAG: L-threonylcarbamoyladenylate synthase [Chloroflexota bacterium]|nr:L-threonylcarbamoyladenylate synthase [Chloroflexota bacterium]
MKNLDESGASDLVSEDVAYDQNVHHVLPPAPLEPGDARRLVILDRSDPQAITWAAEQLAAGGVIAFPTDTVYGVGASLGRPDALGRVYAIKGRPLDRPLPVLLASVEALSRVAHDLDPKVALLLEHYWPGPLTVVVRAREGMPDEVLGPGGTIGTRVPNHPLAIRLLEQVGGALAVTSANRSGAAPACTAPEVADALGDALDLLVDGGPTPGGVPSTVVALAGDDLIILREGAILGDDLTAAWSSLTHEDDGLGNAGGGAASRS